MKQTLLDDFVGIYENLHRDNLDSLRAVYSDQVLFEDSLHKLEGIEPLLQYFEAQYRNLNSCQFDIKEAQLVGSSAWLAWEMCFSHPKLSSGKSITVTGASHLKLEAKIVYHRDYLDMGAMLYEHIPVLGGAIRLIKQRAVG